MSKRRGRARARREFSAEYKAEAVALVHRSGKSIPEVARELERILHQGGLR